MRRLAVEPIPAVVEPIPAAVEPIPAAVEPIPAVAEPIQAALEPVVTVVVIALGSATQTAHATLNVTASAVAI